MTVDRTNALLDLQNNRTITHQVVTEVASFLETDRSELAPLATAVDPDALNKLFGRSSRHELLDGQLTFIYQGVEVTIDSDGFLYLSDAEADGR